MRKKLILGATVASLAMLAASAAKAQSYSNAVMALGPAAYWPLAETTPPPSGMYVATNLGTVGAAGNGFYETWWAQTASNNFALYSTNNIKHVTGVTGDGDRALRDGGVGQYVVLPRFTNGVANSAVTITAPFSIELWAFAYTTNIGLAPMVTQGRNSVGGLYGPNYAGFSLGQYQNKFYFTLYNTNGTTAQPEIDINNIVSNKWYHIVVTFDGTNQTIYSNGAQAQTSALSSRNAAGQLFVPDLVSPLLIGCGTQLGAANGGAPFPGTLDEVAIYTNVLSLARIQTHFGATNSGYAAAVLADNPSLYLRLNEPDFAGPPSPSTYPTANNYGTLGVAANGVYQPGTMPGVAGPGFSGFGSPSYAVAINGFNAGVDIGGGALPALLNPTGSSPLTVAAWFKANPSDCMGRFQTLVGHSDASWRLSLDTAGGNRFNPGAGPELGFGGGAELAAAGAFVNDGNWHFVTGVSDGTNDYLYLDGVLLRSGAGVGSVVGSGADVILGGDPQYLAPQLNGGGGGRFFNGSLAQVAVFTNALSGQQVSQLFAASGAPVPPSFRVQPMSQNAFQNTAATLSAAVSGTAPLSFQWYRQDGSTLDGQTGSSLVFSSVTAANAGSYYLVVTNSYGAVTSSVVQLVVLGPPASTYATAVKALNPAGYWPLDETMPAPYGYYLATNLGTLGAAGNGYYCTWYQPTGNRFYATNTIVHPAGAISDGDTAMQGAGLNGSGQGGHYVILPRATNGVANPALNILSPFSLEVWVKPADTNGGVLPIITEGRNSVQGDASVGYTNAFRGFSLGQYKNFFYFQVYSAVRNDNNGVPELDAKFITTNVWYHVVVTYDGTSATLYTNGVQADKKTASYVPDPVSPLLIGTGTIPASGNGGNEYRGTLDEVAIYTAALTVDQVQAHYAAAAGNTYASTVNGDSPSIYLRLDEPALTSYPSPSTYPVATNYGFAGLQANGAYQPGTTPGVAGPAFKGFGASSRAVALNGFFGAVEVGGGNLPIQLNPQGNTPFSVTAWFQANPADAPARFQNLVGHGDKSGSSSWRLAMDTNTAGAYFNPGNGPTLALANASDMVTNQLFCNDGRWHFAAGVSDGTTASLYVDGVLAKTATGVQGITGNSLDVLLGGDPQYTVPAGNGSVYTAPRYFNGQIAQVAFFTNALTSDQIQQIYGAAGVPPFITLQPQGATNDAGTAVTLTVGVRGSGPFAYQWWKGNTPLAQATSASLSLNPALANDSGSYYVVATNSAGAVTSVVAQVLVYGAPAVRQQSPTDVRVFVGTAPVLRVTATGPQPISYQWSRNGTPISGATASAYTPSTTAIGTSTYTCAITNAFSAGVPTTISTITVKVQADPTAPYPMAVLRDQPRAYYRLDEAANGSGDNGATAYDYAGGLNAVYTNALLDQAGYCSGFTPQSDPGETGVLFGNVNSTDSYAGNVPSYLDFGVPTNNNAQFSVEAWVNGGFGQSLDAGIVTLGYGNGGEQFDLDTGGGSNHSFRFFVRDVAGKTHVVNGTKAANDNGWHHVVGVCDEANGQVLLYIDGQLNGTATIASSSGLLSWTTPLSIGSRQAGNGTGYNSQFNGGVDEVALYGTALSANQVLGHYLAAGIAPAITQQPTNTVANEGATVRFSVAALGTTNLTYQWYENGVAMAGQTSATLTLANVSMARNGFSYYVIVSNLYGSVSSDWVSLQVNGGPPLISVDLQPAFATNWTGTLFTYTVTADGTAPFRYLWTRNGVLIPGATNASYSFPVLAGGNGYAVTVTNNYGSASSTTVTNVGVIRPTLNPLDYNYSLKIGFAGYNRTETLADFPALIQLGTQIPGFSSGQFALAAGGDLRFTDATGTNELPYEIDEWNPEGISSVWVQVPQLSSTNDFVIARWGNLGAGVVPAYTTNGAVWVPQGWEGLPPYDLVWHLKESGFPYADSTLQSPALTGIAPTPATGIVGTGERFGGGSFLTPGAMTNLDGRFTLSAWININPGVSDIQTVWCDKVGGWNANGFGLFVNHYQTSDQMLRLETGNGSGGNAAQSATGAVSFGQWHQLAAVVDKTLGKARLFIDGADVTVQSTAVTDFATDNEVDLGRILNGGFGMNGLMDEARIQAGTNSVNWVWASYMTVAQNATFQSYSPVSSASVTLSYRLSGSNLVLSWPNGELQYATEAAGPYYNLPSATSPYTNAVTGPRLFYRVKVR